MTKREKNKKIDFFFWISNKNFIINTARYEIVAELEIKVYLFYGRVEPLIPTSLTLLGGLTNEERRDPGPLIFPILHHSRLEDLILRVLPDASLYHYPHLDPLMR